MKREDMKVAAKFRAICARCGRQSGIVTAHTADQWMSQHEARHRSEDQGDA